MPLAMTVSTHQADHAGPALARRMPNLEDLASPCCPNAVVGGRFMGERAFHPGRGRPVTPSRLGDASPSCHHPRVLTIPGYGGGPLVEGGAYLDDALFWPVQLGSCLRGEDAQRAAFGADWDAAMQLYHVLSAEREWPTFSVALRSGHTIHVVYRNFDGDRGVDYLIHHPTWPRAETLAVDDGHFMGPGLAWPELLSAGRQPSVKRANAPGARLLLLFPALGHA